jgi:hypothetical protein
MAIAYGFKGVNNNITRGHANIRVQNPGRVILQIHGKKKQGEKKLFSGNVCL